ncbi:MAG: hypothetical protein JWQ99_1637 [Blastococcus sp.]|nr:hypothetical protein [Blastococcus sp.]
MAPPRVRSAHAVDARFIHRLGAGIFGAPWDRYFPTGWRHVASLVGAPGWEFLVVDEGQVAGFAVVQPANDAELRPQPEGIWGELLFLAVAEPKRRAGLGTALLHAAEERYLAAGYLALMASVKPDLTSWYGRRGWRTHPAGAALSFADLRRANAHAARGRPVGYAWLTPASTVHPVWAWKSLDPARPVSAWPMLIPDPRLQDVARITAELQRQESHGLGRIPAELLQRRRSPTEP